MAQRVKRLATMQETWVQSLGQEDPLEKETATHSSFLPGKSHGWKSLVGYSPRGRKKSDMTEWLSSFFLVVPRLKHLPAIWETWVRSLGREDPLEKEMATHSSILA